MEYGLIGAKLGHSYSKIIHEAVCGYSYELHPLPTEEEAHAFMQAKAFKAINVTIPYKKLVIPYCDEVEPRAAAIGAVNTVVNRDGKKVSSRQSAFAEQWSGKFGPTYSESRRSLAVKTFDNYTVITVNGKKTEVHPQAQPQQQGSMGDSL